MPAQWHGWNGAHKSFATVADIVKCLGPKPRAELNYMAVAHFITHPEIVLDPSYPCWTGGYHPSVSGG